MYSRAERKNKQGREELRYPIVCLCLLLLPMVPRITGKLRQAKGFAVGEENDAELRDRVLIEEGGDEVVDGLLKDLIPRRSHIVLQSGLREVDGDNDVSHDSLSGDGGDAAAFPRVPVGSRDGRILSIAPPSFFLLDIQQMTLFALIR